MYQRDSNSEAISTITLFVMPETTKSIYYVCHVS